MTCCYYMYTGDVKRDDVDGDNDSDEGTHEP